MTVTMRTLSEDVASVQSYRNANGLQHGAPLDIANRELAPLSQRFSS